MWILWVGVLLCSASYTMSVPFLPLFLLDLGVDEAWANMWAGMVYSAAFLVGAVMAPFWGAVADKYGKRKMVIRAGISLAVVYALFALVQTPWQLLGARMLHGFVGGFVPASMAIVATAAPEKETGWSLGIMQAGTMSGGILGPLFGGILSEIFGMRMSFVIASILIFLATVAVIIWVKEKHQTNSTNVLQVYGGLKVAFTNRVFVQVLALLFIFQLSVNIIQPLLTLHITSLRGSLEGSVLSSGIIFSLVGIAGIIASPRIGRLGQRFEYRKILYVCLITAGLIVSTQFFVYKLWLFAVVQFMFGLFIAGVVPTANTIAVKNTTADFRGRSFGLTASANQLGSMAGPLVGGALGMFVGIHWVFVATGVILVVTGTVVATRFRLPGAATPATSSTNASTSTKTTAMSSGSTTGSTGGTATGSTTGSTT